MKRKADGMVERLKARLVTKGFHQRPGIDFHETYSTVVKPTTIQIVFIIAISNGWKLHLDVNNAFLQGSLTDDVYMAQPPGFKDVEIPNLIWKLNKTIYGLKQAPRPWYKELSNFLLKFEFVNTTSDAYLFVYTTGSDFLYFLIYVDDLILISNNDYLMSGFLSKMPATFSLKDIGLLNLPRCRGNITIHWNFSQSAKIYTGFAQKVWVAEC